eukprot:5706260-Amphidinium_carterae.2
MGDHLQSLTRIYTVSVLLGRCMGHVFASHSGMGHVFASPSGGKGFVQNCAGVGCYVQMSGLEEYVMSVIFVVSLITAMLLIHSVYRWHASSSKTISNGRLLDLVCRVELI